MQNNLLMLQGIKIQKITKISIVLFNPEEKVILRQQKKKNGKATTATTKKKKTEWKIHPRK